MNSLYGDLTPSPNMQSLFDKHNLGASGGEGEGDYDCLVPGTVVSPFGSGDNYGIWFDRDTVDQWQATYWGAVNGGTYNTGGIYTIVIQYHAINANLGTMFATVNGIQTGFYAAGWKNQQPDSYPAGLSFKGDMTRMQVFEGIIAPDSGAVYGYTIVHNLTVTGELGISSPLVADFTYNPTVVGVGTSVQFTDTSTGGYLPYSAWSWNFGDGGTSTAENPSHIYTTAGDYSVKLTVTGHCPYCGSATVTKKIHVYAYYLTVTSPYGTTSGSGWYDAGQIATFSITPTKIPITGTVLQHVFTGWSSSDPHGYTGPTPSNSVTMNNAITETASWTTQNNYSVGGQWTPITMQTLSPINALQLLAPWIALALIGLASAVAAYRRMFKKHW